MLLLIDYGHPAARALRPGPRQHAPRLPPPPRPRRPVRRDRPPGPDGPRRPHRGRARGGRGRPRARSAAPRQARVPRRPRHRRAARRAPDGPGHDAGVLPRGALRPGPHARPARDRRLRGPRVRARPARRRAPPRLRDARAVIDSRSSTAVCPERGGAPTPAQAPQCRGDVRGCSRVEFARSAPDDQDRRTRQSANARRDRILCPGPPGSLRRARRRRPAGGPRLGTPSRCRNGCGAAEAPRGARGDRGPDR